MAERQIARVYVSLETMSRTLTEVLNQAGEGVDLGFRGQTLISKDVEYSVGLTFTGSYFLRLESPVVVGTPANEFHLNPEDTTADFGPLRDLVGCRVTESTADSGVLEVRFENGCRLRVDPDDSYEAWTLAGPRGMKVVCMPGGELAVWRAEPS